MDTSSKLSLEDKAFIKKLKQRQSKLLQVAIHYSTTFLYSKITICNDLFTRMYFFLQKYASFVENLRQDADNRFTVFETLIDFVLGTEVSALHPVLSRMIQSDADTIDLFDDMKEFYLQLTTHGKAIFLRELHSQEAIFFTANQLSKYKHFMSWNSNEERMMESQEDDMLHLQGPWHPSLQHENGGHKQFTEGDKVNLEIGRRDAAKNYEETFEEIDQRVQKIRAEELYELAQKRTARQMKHAQIPTYVPRQPVSMIPNKSILSEKRKNENDSEREKKRVKFQQKIGNIHQLIQIDISQIECSTCHNKNEIELFLCKGCYNRFFCGAICQKEYSIQYGPCNKYNE